MNLQTALNEASYLLKKKKIISASLDSEILLSHVIKKDREYILLNLKKDLKKKYIHEFEFLIKARSLNTPVSYLVGKKNFWKYEFNISKDVLIPRPDTELIVDQVLKFTKFKSNQKILDIGVGSGCILLSILNEKLDFSGIGIDISKKSIDICKTNVIKFGLEKRVKLFKSDIDNFDCGKYDLIVSNPPYIKNVDLKYLEKNVVGFEPKLALDGGLDGVSVIRKVICKSSKLIKKNGKLFLEIAFDQRKKVEKILKKNGFYINQVLRDFAKNERCIISTKL